MILSFLQTKYEVDMPTVVEALATDILVGAFDLLTNALNQKETDLFYLKSFLINRIPPWIGLLASPK